MTPEILTTIGCTTALAAVIAPGQASMRRDVADLRERMARLEGTIDVLREILTGRQSAGAGRPPAAD